MVFLRVNWYVTEELGSLLSATRREVLVQLLLLQLHGPVPALCSPEALAEAAQLADLHF